MGERDGAGVGGSDPVAVPVGGRDTDPEAVPVCVPGTLPVCVPAVLVAGVFVPRVE
jgi:hypothetical protein